MNIQLKQALQDMIAVEIICRAYWEASWKDERAERFLERKVKEVNKRVEELTNPVPDTDLSDDE